ncbi:MAG TPA: winged helix-turn-helix domain-containing protein [Jatrophihabitans sp.]|nr:winged helix-turn-helix domain-containing protein [Jatrophihabitans sp.]
MGIDYAAVARLLASPARSAVVDVLMAGRPMAAGELARAAGVPASTVSEQLAEMVDGGLLAVVSAGRHRYYRMASADVAEALAAFSRICPDTPVRSLRQSAAHRSMRVARLCYDHLAGALGVALLDRLLAIGWLTRRDGAGANAPDYADFEVTSLGASQLAEIGVDLESCRQARRHFALACLDWSARRPHLAGALGAGIAYAMCDRDWFRTADTARGVQVTREGQERLLATFRISMNQLAAQAN